MITDKMYCFILLYYVVDYNAYLSHTDVLDGHQYADTTGLMTDRTVKILVLGGILSDLFDKGGTDDYYSDNRKAEEGDCGRSRTVAHKVCRCILWIFGLRVIDF